MAPHRFTYPTVREIRPASPPAGVPPTSTASPSQRELVEASLRRRPATRKR